MFKAFVASRQGSDKPIHTYSQEPHSLLMEWIKSQVYTVKSVLSGHSKLDKIKVLKTFGSLVKVKSITECSHGAFCNTFDLQKTTISLENQFLLFFLSGHLRDL